MSGGEVRKVSPQDIQLVQNLIEQCLPHYMSQKEVIDLLFVQEKIEPSFTELVWQKLEEQNQDFFQGYHLRLIVKEQIMEFNRLLGRQVELMHQVGSTEVGFAPMSNGSQMPMHQRTTSYAHDSTRTPVKADSMQQPVTANLPSAFNNRMSSMHSNKQTVGDESVHSSRIAVSPDVLLAQSNVGMIHGMNGGGIKREVGYVGSSRFNYGTDGNVLEARSAIGDASISSFSVDSNSQPLNGNLLDDTSSFGLFGQISRAFNFSDLTADFSNSSDILESYPRSSFLTPDTDNFLESDSNRIEHHVDSKRLSTISEGLNYDDFGSD